MYKILPFFDKEDICEKEEIMKKIFLFSFIIAILFFHLYGTEKITYNDSLNISLIGKYPMGRVTDITFYENYAYVISGNGVIILDISDSLNITQISAVSLKQKEYTYLSQVEVKDTLMYLLVNARSIYIIDISDLYNPYIISQWEMPDFGEDFLVSFTVYDNYIYAVSSAAHLYVVNTSTINAPICVNEYDLTEGNMFGIVDIINGYLVCVNSYIWVYYLGDPSSPKLVNKIVNVFGGEVYEIKHYENYWFVVAEYAVFCYEGSFPSDIVYIGKFTSFPDGCYAKDVYMTSDSSITIFYKYDYDKTRIVRYPFEIFDSTATIADTMVIVLKDTNFMDKHVVEKIKAYNGINYLLYSSGVLTGVSIQSLSYDIDYDKNFVWGSDVDRLKWESGKIFLFANSSILGTLDNLNENLSLWSGTMFDIEKDIMSYDFGDSSEVFIWDEDSTYIYKYDGDTFYKLATISLSRIDTVGSAKRSGDLLYVSDGGVLHVYDVSDFSNIVELSTYNDHFDYIIIRDNYLYGINGNKFEILNISDSYNIEQVSYIYLSPGEKFCLYGDYAYIMQSDNVSIVDISNPQNIYVVNTIGTDDIIRSIEVDTLRDLLYIVEDTVMEVYNIQDVNSPQLEGYYTFNYYLSFAFDDVCVDDNGVVYVSGRDGIYVLSFVEPNYVDDKIGEDSSFVVYYNKGAIIFNMRRNNDVVKISIYDIMGRKMVYKETRGQNISVNIEHSGLYYYEIECEGKKERGKIMVVK